VPEKAAAVSKSGLGELILFVRKNAKAPSIREDISLIYLEFVLAIDTLMSTNEKWSNARNYNINVVRAELESLTNPLTGGIA